MIPFKILFIDLGAKFRLTIVVKNKKVASVVVVVVIVVMVALTDIAIVTFVVVRNAITLIIFQLN